VFFATQSDRFLTGGNLSLILQQVMVVGVIAIGQTLIILTAGIDLSCGMVMALGGIVMTKFAVDWACRRRWPCCAAWASPRCSA
jgi:fructose transport system permease protein